jgi:hypothetical protein
MSQRATTFIPDYLPILVTKELRSLSPDVVSQVIEALWYKNEPFIDAEAFHLIWDDARKYIKWEVSKYNWASLRTIHDAILSSSVLRRLAFYPEDSPNP